MTIAEPTDPKGKKPKPKVRYIRLRNKLQSKVGGAKRGEAGSVSPEVLEKALAEMKKAEEEYPEWVRKTLVELVDELKGAKEKQPNERTKHFKRVGAIAHELKGQGGTFGYPLISAIGKSLNDFTQRDVLVTDNHLEILKAHIDTMRAVINGHVSGDGGGIGRELIESLEHAIAKYGDTAAS